ncbi:MAG: methyltransferase domain-containing protein [Planctomycetaceae bacterium]|nr:methyltransferase domain-containing protein [Planctomycetaceae bacterium]
MSTEGNNPWDFARPKFKTNLRVRPQGEEEKGDTAGEKRNRKNRKPDPSSPERNARLYSSGENQDGITGSKEDFAAIEAKVAAITSGRLLAWRALQLFEHGNDFLQDILSDLDRHHQLSSGERGQAVDLSSGVVRRRRTIDAVIAKQLTRPRHNVENDLWRVLQLGVYQILFAATPDHAAVDSSVKLCRQLNRERWTKFVNGVLRGIARMVADNVETESNEQMPPDAAFIPVSPGYWVQMTQPVLTDPSQNLAEWFGDAFSLPSALAVRWTGRMSMEELMAAGFHSLYPASLSVRINKRQATVDTVREALTGHCIVEEGHSAGTLRISSTGRVEQLPGFMDGDWSIQDASATAAAELAAPRPGESILDLCAAPGGKTCHLAELTDDKAMITACDISGSRLERIRQNTERLNIRNVQLCLVAKDGTNLPDGPFDLILVDVPCSNTGVLGRRPEARWRFSTEDLAELVTLQTRLLIQACERIAPAGRIVYSTCSIEAEENRRVVDAVLQAFPAIRLERDQQFLPGRPSDGAYQALLVSHR